MLMGESLHVPYSFVIASNLLRSLLLVQAKNGIS